MNECSILWCGKYHQNWENELHCHNYFQMVGILSGSGTVYVDDQPYEIEKEQVFLLCPQQLHAIHCGEKNAAPLKMLDVKFTVADPALFEDLVRVGDMFHLQDFGWFVRFFDKIIAESAQQRPYYYSIISGYLLEMLVRIVRERLGQPAAAPEEEAPRVATFKGVDVAAPSAWRIFPPWRASTKQRSSASSRRCTAPRPSATSTVSACARPRSFW